MAEAKLTPKSAAALLEPKLAGFSGALTVADGAARGGLSLRDAEAGLRVLTAERGGHLAATEKGELLYSFPRGLVAPRAPGLLARAGRAVGRALAGVGRFVVRAWVSIALVTYAVVFAGVAIALAAKDDGDGAGEVIGAILRVVFEALYWTFHPFSPLAWQREPTWALRRRKGARGLPFYERVNRFVFGPPPVVEDPRERERRIVAEIRRLAGRVAPGDVMRVTGLDRDAAERELLRLTVDYEGDIGVSEEGALVYTFKALRPTAGAAETALAPAPVWTDRAVARPVTGNGAATNVFLGALNGFNLVMGTVAVANGLTVERIFELVRHAHEVATVGAAYATPLPPAHGVPWALGWIPLAFSAGIFAFPALRALRQRRERARAADENGRRALMRLVLADGAGAAELRPADAGRAWLAAAGPDGGATLEAATPRIEAAVRALGGEIDLDADGKLVYRFAVAARERAALAATRGAASAGEAAPGAIVFSSDEKP
jgi:hypothetical protein